MWGLEKRNRNRNNSKKLLAIICLSSFVAMAGLGSLDLQVKTEAAGPRPAPHRMMGPPPGGTRMAPPPRGHQLPPPPPRSHRYYSHFGYWGNGWDDPFWGGGIFSPVIVRTRTVVAIPSVSMVERENYYKDNVLALVKNAGLWGTIDRQGKILMSPAYKYLVPVGKGAFYASNKSNELIKVDKYGHAMAVTNAENSKSSSNTSGVENETPQEATIKTVDEMPTNPVMWAKGKNGYVLLDSQGQMVKPSTPKVDVKAYRDAEEAKKAQEQSDLASDVPVKVSDVKGFRHGVSPAKQNGKWGIVNSEGKWLVRPIYEDVKML